MKTSLWVVVVVLVGIVGTLVGFSSTGSGGAPGRTAPSVQAGGETAQLAQAVAELREEIARLRMGQTGGAAAGSIGEREGQAPPDAGKKAAAPPEGSAGKKASADPAKPATPPAEAGGYGGTPAPAKAASGGTPAPPKAASGGHPSGQTSTAGY